MAATIELVQMPVEMVLEAKIAEKETRLAVRRSPIAVKSGLSAKRCGDRREDGEHNDGLLFGV
jgi:hypothetical protein